MIITKEDLAPPRKIIRPDRTEWLRPVVQFPKIRPYHAAFKAMANPVFDKRKALDSQIKAHQEIVLSLAREMIEGHVDLQNLPENINHLIDYVDPKRAQSENMTVALWSAFLQEDVEGIHLDDDHVRKSLDYKFELFPVSPEIKMDFVIHLPKWMNVTLSDGTVMDMVWFSDIEEDLLQITFMQTPGPFYQNHRSVHSIVFKDTKQKDLAKVIVQDDLVEIMESGPRDDTRRTREEDLESIAFHIEEVCSIMMYTKIMKKNFLMDFGMRGDQGKDRFLSEISQLIVPEKVFDIYDKNQSSFYHLVKSGWRHVFVIPDN